MFQEKMISSNQCTVYYNNQSTAHYNNQSTAYCSDNEGYQNLILEMIQQNETPARIQIYIDDLALKFDWKEQVCLELLVKCLFAHIRESLELFAESLIEEQHTTESLIEETMQRFSKIIKYYISLAGPKTVLDCCLHESIQERLIYSLLTLNLINKVQLIDWYKSIISVIHFSPSFEEWMYNMILSNYYCKNINHHERYNPTSLDLCIECESVETLQQVIECSTSDDNDYSSRDDGDQDYQDDESLQGGSDGQQQDQEMEIKKVQFSSLLFKRNVYILDDDIYREEIEDELVYN